MRRGISIALWCPEPIQPEMTFCCNEKGKSHGPSELSLRYS